MLWVWILFGLILITLFLLFSRIYFTCHFTYTQHKQVILIGVYFYRLRLLQREINLNSNEESAILDIWKGKDFLEGLHDLQNECRNIIDEIRDLRTLTALFLKKVKIIELNWHTHVGTGEASKTGLATGSVWIIKGLLIGFISKQSNLNCQPNTSVQPYFQFKYIQSTVDCIVSIKIGQAIYVFLKATRKISSKQEAAYIK